MEKYNDATDAEIDNALQQSWIAFHQYRQLSLQRRADFLRAIAVELQAASDDLIAVAHQETHLQRPRLDSELKRTIFQLTSYAAACKEGTWLDIRIDSPLQVSSASKTSPVGQQTKSGNDLRKMLIPLGPVVVFGASNFPFAYSTAGGDTACALAAGCPVIIKGHPAHACTSTLVAAAVQRAATQNQLPASVFIHLHGASFEVGKALVLHRYTAAVAFTGSVQGGRALFDLAAQRAVPIPVFAEMGSVNPVFLLPIKLEKDLEKISEMYAASITESAGQFCTNPGILVGIESEVLHAFAKRLGEKIAQVWPVNMLHSGISKSFHQKRKAVLEQQGVTLIAETKEPATADESIPTLASVSGKQFLQTPQLHQEVFGPFSLLIVCADKEELLQVASSMEGQLTATLMATDGEVKQNSVLVEALKNICGRFILNGVPTGVQVALAMQHGGPYPATTDSRFTAVGADGIRRFARPICFQNWTNELLPVELQNENPLGLWRTVNNALTQEALS
jgi:NADP-dependent aldehyde dehydrogenase